MALRQLDTNDYSDFNWYSPDKSTRKQKYDELLQLYWTPILASAS